MIERDATRILARFAVLVVLVLLASPSAFARPRPKPKPPAPRGLDEVLRHQSELLERMQRALDEQGRKIDAQSDEIRQLREQIATAGAGTAAAAGAAAATDDVATSASLAPAPATAREAAGPATPVAGTAASGDEARANDARVDEWWRRIALAGEIRIRGETAFNRGLDRAGDLETRNRLYYRVRLRLTESINEHADWGLFLTSGDLGLGSQNQELTGEFSRKPIGVQAAYVHYTTASDPVSFDVTAGKFLFPWELPAGSFSDNNLSAEGLTEAVTFSLPERSKLRGVTATTWQLPFVERANTRDAYVYGGQLETDWQWSKNWSTTAWSQLFDFADFPRTADADVISSFSRRPSLLSTQIVETRYDGWGERAKSGASRWELLERLEFLHRFDRDVTGRTGLAWQMTLGRIEKRGDWLFDNTLFRNEPDVLPDFFISSSGVATNTEGDVFATSYMLEKQIWFRARYFLARRLDPVGPYDRLFNRLQFDVRYVF
jgi:hypothetical protein